MECQGGVLVWGREGSGGTAGQEPWQTQQTTGRAHLSCHTMLACLRLRSGGLAPPWAKFAAHGGKTGRGRGAVGLLALVGRHAVVRPALRGPSRGAVLPECCWPSLDVGTGLALGALGIAAAVGSAPALEGRRGGPGLGTAASAGGGRHPVREYESRTISGRRHIVRQVCGAAPGPAN